MVSAAVEQILANASSIDSIGGVGTLDNNCFALVFCPYLLIILRKSL